MPKHKWIVCAGLSVQACFYNPTINDAVSDGSAAPATTSTPTTQPDPLDPTATAGDASTGMTAGTGIEMPTICGNGVVESGEECDDENDVPVDGCEGDCFATRITEIFATSGRTCVLLEKGYLKCWGYNDDGQLGYGHTDSIGDDEPASAAGIIDAGGKIVKVAMGLKHTCVIVEGGSVRCWGSGNYGRLGRGDVGGATCLNDAMEFSCSANSACCIGDDEVPSSISPVDVGEPATDIVAGATHSCVLLNSGTVRCWGDGSLGQLGIGSTMVIGDDEVPTSINPVSLGDAAIRIYGGFYDTCAILSAGNVRCWGYNGSGSLGVGQSESVGDDEVPISLGSVPIGGTVVAMSLADETTCVSLEGGHLKCWGLAGTLGNGTKSGLGTKPGDIPPPDINVGGEVVEIGGGNTRTCARLSDGTLRCWGYEFNGNLGYPEDEDIGDDPGEMPPVPIKINGTPTQMAVGGVHTCVVLDGRRVACWGYGMDGSLGYGNMESLGDDPGEMPTPDVAIFK